MKKAIKSSIRGGWKPKHLNDHSLQRHQFHRCREKYSTWYKEYSKDNEPTYCYLPHEVALLDPEFWKCLGKSEGWTYDEWLYRWHELIDHLAKEKDIDSFFNGILK